MRRLNSELHKLRAEAHEPSVRALARVADCSHTTVHALFAKSSLPSGDVLLAVVEEMAKRAKKENVDEIVDRFDLLWQQARDDRDQPIRSLRDDEAALAEPVYAFTVRQTLSDWLYRSGLSRQELASLISERSSVVTPALLAHELEAVLDGDRLPTRDEHRSLRNVLACDADEKVDAEELLALAEKEAEAIANGKAFIY